MKKLLCLLLLAHGDVVCMSRLVGAVGRPAQKNMQLCLNTPRNFGTTHFIVGYKGAIEVPQIIDKKISSPKSIGAQCIDKNCHTQSFFTSIHDIPSILQTIVSESKKSVYIAAFTLTDIHFVDHIIQAHKNGVDVCVIVDASATRQTYNKVQKLIDNNVPVWRYSPSLNPRYKKNGMYEPIMHHKCILVDGEVVVTGSANFTKAGQKYNAENINILRDKQAVNDYRDEFERLKKQCVKCTTQVAV